jgi:hypothetical protein
VLLQILQAHGMELLHAALPHLLASPARPTQLQLSVLTGTAELLRELAKRPEEGTEAAVAARMPRDPAILVQLVEATLVAARSACKAYMDKPLPRFKAYNYNPNLRPARQVGELPLIPFMHSGPGCMACA